MNISSYVSCSVFQAYILNSLTKSSVALKFWAVLLNVPPKTLKIFVTSPDRFLFIDSNFFKYLVSSN